MKNLSILLVTKGDNALKISKERILVDFKNIEQTLGHGSRKRNWICMFI